MTQQIDANTHELLIDHGSSKYIRTQERTDPESVTHDGRLYRRCDLVEAELKRQGLKADAPTVSPTQGKNFSPNPKDYSALEVWELQEKIHELQSKVNDLHNERANLQDENDCVGTYLDPIIRGYENEIGHLHELLAEKRLRESKRRSG